jgi:hypothetical protein
MASPRPLSRWLRTAACLALLLGGNARADDPWEFWPELNLYQGLSPTTRLYLVTAYGTGKESTLRTLDLAGYFDVTLKPRLIQHLSVEESDWERNKYLWLRVGFDYIVRAEGETRIVPEYRGIVALSARAYLPEEILVELRARADLRWIEGDSSTRYRFRVEVNREFMAWGHPVTPWVQAEVFYDTRYDGWARQLYQAGAEVGLTEHFRLEPSVARQVDTLPDPVGLWAVALVARWYY